ncbi:O-methyltransferase [Streptomyces laurentii]|uniref:O-methyltransferase n=1 Tax=Streptomyces laurentii TaxID=39478 RepID=A0A160NU44_STRLU|nr:O-methyltransferase [Streptomyces laurentii]
MDHAANTCAAHPVPKKQTTVSKKARTDAREGEKFTTAYRRHDRPQLSPAELLALGVANERKHAAKYADDERSREARTAQNRMQELHIDPHVTEATRERLSTLGFRPAVVTGDGTTGWSDAGPYDRNFVSFAVRHVPQALVKQPAPGGRALMTLGTSSPSWPGLAVLERRPDGSVEAELRAVEFGHRAGAGFSRPPPSTVCPPPSSWTWGPAPARPPAHCCPYCTAWCTSTWSTCTSRRWRRPAPRSYRSAEHARSTSSPAPPTSSPPARPAGRPR